MNHVAQALILKKQLDDLKPISPLLMAKINQKFRLDWNFHSNKLEGNSLNFGETKTFLLHGTTSAGKPFKDYLEIKGHNEAIKLVEDFAAESDFLLTENFIRELHAIILKEPYEVDAITPDKKPTKKLIEIGKYKSSPNHVKTKTGEIFYFAEHYEVSAKMFDLLAWYKKESEAKDLNPIILAATFHYKFIRIHPFDDGNGRIARLLMNFILMKFGFSLVVIKTQDKENYFNALRQADGGLIESFVEYVAKNLVHSLEITIKGAKGEEIEEDDDLDKKIILLKKSFENSFSPNVIIKSKEVVLKICNNFVENLFDAFLSKCEKFDSFYNSTRKNAQIEADGLTRGFSPALQPLDFINSIEGDITKIYVEYVYQGLKREGVTTQHDFFNHIGIKFYPDKYIFSNIQGLNNSLRIEKKYSEEISQDEINKIIKLESDRHYQKIENLLTTFNQTKS